MARMALLDEDAVHLEKIARFWILESSLESYWAEAESSKVGKHLRHECLIRIEFHQ